MLKKAALLIGAAIAIGAIAVAGLYLAGYRVALAGSGMPRFVSKPPDDAVLEADRARQRERAAARTVAPIPAPQTPAAVATTANTPPPRSDAPGASPARANSSPRRDYWPDFLGARRDGRYDAGPIRTDWPAAGLPLLWKQPIGLGYASFVVADGRAFTIEQRRQQEVVSAYDVDTGRELWTHGWDASFVESLGGDGPRATPTYHDGRLYALGALGELECLEARSGELVWRHNILVENGAPNVT